MKETIKYRRSSWTYTHREVTDLSFSDRLVEQQVFVSCIRRYWLHTCTIYKISQLQSPSIWNQLPHGILRLYWWRGQERIPPIPLELLLCDLVVGVPPAAPKANLKKVVNTYIWMKLNTNDGIKIKLWILLLTHFKVFFRVAPLRDRRVVDVLANVVSTKIIPAFLPQPLYEKQRSIKLIIKHYKWYWWN